MKKLLQKKAFLGLSASVISIIIGFAFGFLVLLASNPGNAIGGFMTILMGGFSEGMKGTGNVLYFATPIILTGLSVGFAFRTGLFNIGASGQFILGAFTAIYIGVKWTFIPPSVLWIVALLGAAVAGGIWAMVPGLLKAFRNVNEVISSIMMNYIGMYIVNFMVVQTVFDSAKNQSITPYAATIPKFGLERIFPDSSINFGFIIAIAVAILIYIVLQKTTFGFELKACGFNRHASEYAGMNSKRNIWMSMLIAGALSGLGGGLLYLAGSGKHIQVVDVLAQEGFNGISVALLGLSNPIGIIFAGIFIAYITIGGFYMQVYQYAPEVINIMIAVIIYLSAFSLFFREKIADFIKRIGVKA
jgi:simple sugar transport system permease protein